MNRLHPSRAVTYYRSAASNRHSRGNDSSAILWLFAALVALLVIRNRTLPDGSQTVTLLGAAIVVVLIGTVAPAAVVAVLAGLLIAGVLNAPGVGPFLTMIEARVSDLAAGRGAPLSLP